MGKEITEVPTDERAWACTHIRDKRATVRQLVLGQIAVHAAHPRARLVAPKLWTVAFSNSHVVPHIAVTDFDNQEVMIAQWLLAHNTRAICEDIALHEVAHVLAGYSAGHERDWVWWCGKLGCRPKPLFTPNDIKMGRRLIT